MMPWQGYEKGWVVFLKDSEGKIISANVETVNSRGDGVVRSGDDRFVFFVPGALPGERITGKVVIVKKSYGVLDLLEVKEPSPERIEPRCPWYGRCGGCALQHASYGFQLKMKDTVVMDAFRKVASMVLPGFEGCVPSPLQWGYRNKASFPVQMSKGVARAGFYSQKSHDLVPVDVCPVLEERLESWIGPIGSALKRSGIQAYDESEHNGLLRHIVARCAGRTSSSMVVPVVCLAPGKDIPAELKNLADMFMEEFSGVGGVNINFNPLRGNTIHGRYSRLVAGDGSITDNICGFSVKYGPTSFFQINSLQAEFLFKAAVEELDLLGCERVLELYSGTGALTLNLARGRKKVHAVEEWPESAGYLRENALINGVENIHVLEMSSERGVQFLGRAKFDVVVVDPPRKGCSEHVLKGISAIDPEYVIYISCNPSTLARDCAFLMEKGYRLRNIRTFDMFPQTFHVETIATMVKERRKKRKPGPVAGKVRES
jgi:23S rRNA (uracil1939-C5)-methyltransferase